MISTIRKIFLLACLATPCKLFAQEEKASISSAAKTPLASKQEMIRDRFERFQDRVFGLRDQLSESEPENAARLERALQKAGELGLADKLEEIIALLNDPSSMHKAAAEEEAWLANAQNILQLLLAQDADAEKRKEEMERLKQYQEQVERLLKEQKEVRNEAGQAAALQRMKAQLDQAIQRAGQLQKRQSALSQNAQSQGAQKPGDPSDAQKQEDLGRDTDQLSKDLKAMAEPPSDRGSDSPQLEKARQDTEEASKSSQSSSQSMSQAAQKMQQGQSGQSGASPQQQQAEEELQKTIEQLEAARKALEDPDLQQSAEKQEKLAEDTKGLEEKMQQDAAGGKGQQGQQGQQGQKGQKGKEGSQSQSPPGAQNLQQAQQEMNKAAESLGKKSAAEATPKQDKAIEQLQAARQELERALEELRKEERAETLRDLEARIRDMLAKQKPINEQTIGLDKVGEQYFKRAEHLQLADLSTQQRALSEKAETCLHILDEDASTIAFPHVMQQLVDDMGSSADRLAAFQSGPITQTIQADIIDALEQLLDSVKKMQEENENQQGQPQQQQQGPPPLLPPSAELKLLRSSQLRINNRTGVIATQIEKGAEEKTVASKSLVKLSERQIQTADIAREIRDKQKQ